MELTVEQINLICIFDHSSRAAIIGGLLDALDGFEDELRDIALSCLSVLYRIGDDEFAQLELYPIYE